MFRTANATFVCAKKETASVSKKETTVAADMFDSGPAKAINASVTYELYILFLESNNPPDCVEMLFMLLFKAYAANMCPNS